MTSPERNIRFNFSFHVERVERIEADIWSLQMGLTIGRVVGLVVVLGLLGLTAATRLLGAMLAGEGDGWVLETLLLDSNFSLASSWDTWDWCRSLTACSVPPCQR